MKKVLSFLLVLLMTLGMLAAFPVGAAAADEGWDGSTAAKPEGAGTKEDPYLVSSAENLMWLSNMIPRGDRVANDHADVAAGKYVAAFQNVWFAQTCDIDLNGKMLPSIGYYYSNDKRMGAFGGHYDGNGCS